MSIDQVSAALPPVTLLSVTALALGYAWAVARRKRRLVEALTLRLPPTKPRDVRAVLEGHLRHASELFGGSIVVLWEAPDDPSPEIAHWTGTELLLHREPSDAFHPFVAGDLTLDRFGTADATRVDARVLRLTSEGLRPWRGAAVNQALVDRFGFRRLVSAPFAGYQVTGRIFAMIDRPAHQDDLVIVGAVARRIGEALAQILLTRELLDLAALEERDRLSRELHDGVLQSLAGVALHLNRAERAAETNPVTVRAALASAQQLLADEQRDLRFYLQDLRPLEANVADTRSAFEARLGQLGVRVTDVWGLRVHQDVQPLPRAVSPRTTHELYRITQEALANVARHSGATEASLAITFSEHAAHITVSDNGRGFPFRGRFSDAELAAQRLGPVTLKARIHSLEGSIDIDSADTGARLDIAVPLTPRDA